MKENDDKKGSDPFSDVNNKNAIGITLKLSICLVAFFYLCIPRIAYSEPTGENLLTIKEIPLNVPAEVLKPWMKRSYEDRIRNGRYEDWYSFKHGKTFAVDPFVWVYSKKFAERFHMPKEWVDNDLKGLMAAAWTMNTLGNTVCGYGGNPKSCWKPLNCQLDVYYDNKIPLPWGYPDIVRFTSPRYINSTTFLVSSVEDKTESFGAEWLYSGMYTKPNKPLLSGGGDFRYGKYNQGYSDLFSFNKKLQSDIGLITWVGSGVCAKYTGVDEVSLKFVSQGDYNKMRYGKLRWQGINDEQLVHKMVFPRSFMLRANKVYQELNKPNQNVIDGLIKQSLQRMNSNK